MNKCGKAYKKENKFRNDVMMGFGGKPITRTGNSYSAGDLN